MGGTFFREEVKVHSCFEYKGATFQISLEGNDEVSTGRDALEIATACSS